MTTDLQSAPAPEAAPATAPILPSAEAWVAERRAKREAAAPVRGDDGKFVSKNPQAEEAAPVEEAPEAIEESEAAPQAADDAEGEPQANPEGEDAAPLEPPEAAIEPPQFWDAEGKERFAKLSPASQKEVVEYEKQRTVAVAKAMQKSADLAKASEAKLRQLSDTAEQMGEWLDTRTDRIKQWDDWFASEGVELARTSPGAYVAEEARYKAEKHEFEKVEADKAKIERETFRAYREEQARLLAEVAPELVDPKEGAKRMTETVSYLREKGFEPDRIRMISATEASIAHKAMLYDRAQARAKEAPKPKPPKPAGPQAAPAGQGQRASSSEARLKALTAPNKVLSQEEFMELRRLRRKG